MRLLGITKAIAIGIQEDGPAGQASIRSIEDAITILILEQNTLNLARNHRAEIRPQIKAAGHREGAAPASGQHPPIHRIENQHARACRKPAENKGAIGTRGYRCFIGIPLAIIIVIQEHHRAAQRRLAHILNAVAVKVVEDKAADLARCESTDREVRRLLARRE